MTKETDNEAFVRAYQAKNGLTVDGWAGKKTMESLDGGGTMKTSQRGIDLIHSFESFREDAYKDPGSANGLPITIGWGSTSDLSGRPIKLGDRWTREQADAKLAQDLAKFEGRVRQHAPKTTQNQFDALVSFDYNTGAIHSATLTKKHNSGDYAGAKAEFARWNKNDGKVMNGLVRRRAAEADLYGR